MQGSPAKKLVRRIMSRADVALGGNRAWDIQVHHPAFYRRILIGGSLALGESYMDGWWDCRALDQLVAHLLQAKLDRHPVPTIHFSPALLRARLAARQSRSHAFEIGKRHYDLSNTLFTAMLDRGLNYSCGYWPTGTADLDEAQGAKLELTCRKLGLAAGMRVLDIGCGWGGFAVYAARNFGAAVTGITVSAEQARLARQRAAGLPVKIELMDYRDLKGRYDRVVSIGMFEHVGLPKYRTYMRKVHQCLIPGGLFLLHTIGSNISVRQVDPWFAKYIFPNSMLPSVRQISAAAEGRFVLEDWHSFGPHYDRTLMAWHTNFIRAWPDLKAHYDDRFFRMWSYYLLASAGSFRARHNQLWQIVFSKGGVPGGYHSVRTPDPANS